MINPFKEIDWKPDRKAIRTFGRSLLIGFPILATVFFLAGWWTGEARPPAGPYLVVATIGMAVGLLAIIAPVLAKPFYYLWYAFAAVMGLIVSNLILTAIYYALFTPIGVIRRWSGSSPVRLHPDPQAVTYWVDLPPPPAPESYFRQF